MRLATAGQRAYDTYAALCGWRDGQGQAMPAWPVLGRAGQETWCRVACAVLWAHQQGQQVAGARAHAEESPPD